MSNWKQILSWSTSLFNVGDMVTILSKSVGTPLGELLSEVGDVIRINTILLPGTESYSNYANQFKNWRQPGPLNGEIMYMAGINHDGGVFAARDLKLADTVETSLKQSWSETPEPFPISEYRYKPQCPLCGGFLDDAGSYKWDCPNGCLPMAMEMDQINDMDNDTDFHMDLNDIEPQASLKFSWALTKPSVGDMVEVIANANMLRSIGITRGVKLGDVLKVTTINTVNHVINVYIPGLGFDYSFPYKGWEAYLKIVG